MGHERLNYINIPETETPITFKYNNPDGSTVEKPLTLLEFVYMLVYVPYRSRSKMRHV